MHHESHTSSIRAGSQTIYDTASGLRKTEMSQATTSDIRNSKLCGAETTWMIMAGDTCFPLALSWEIIVPSTSTSSSPISTQNHPIIIPSTSWRREEREERQRMTHKQTKQNVCMWRLGRGACVKKKKSSRASVNRLFTSLSIHHVLPLTWLPTQAKLSMIRLLYG